MTAPKPGRSPRRRQPKQAGERPSQRTHPSQEESSSWEHVARWYDALAAQQGSDFHQGVIIPGVLRLLDLKAGERVLDVACGQGVVSRALQKAGAEVTGVDLSPTLIKQAQRRSGKAARFLVGDARNLEQVLPESEAFDGAVCVLALENLDTVEPVFGECARLLRKGGRLVTVTAHPAFRIPRQSSWGWDEPRQLLFRAVDLYLSPLKVPIELHPFREQQRKQVTWTYHRPIQAYVQGLAQAGLWVNALEEWPSHRKSQPGPRAKAEDRARFEFPLFLALRAVKV
ncbi:MAG: class I SAM-dependent methyltransferase [Chloroflexi bacterium]|nr:class I SAM-dependent methyltransferase [Chloroflexota bacterium]